MKKHKCYHNDIKCGTYRNAEDDGYCSDICRLWASHNVSREEILKIKRQKQINGWCEFRDWMKSDPDYQAHLKECYKEGARYQKSLVDFEKKHGYARPQAQYLASKEGRDDYINDLKLNNPRKYLDKIKHQKIKNSAHITTIYNVDKDGKRTVCKRTIN